MSDDYVRQVAEAAAAMGRIARAALARRPADGDLAREGNVILFPESAESGVCWVVAERTGTRATLVPADAFQIIGDGDVPTEPDEALGNLVLRPTHALDVEVDELRRARFVGTIASGYVARARSERSRTGVTRDPDLREWLDHVTASSTRIRARAGTGIDTSREPDPAGWVRVPVTLRSPSAGEMTVTWPEVGVPLGETRLMLTDGVTRLPLGDTRFTVRADRSVDADLVDLAIEDREGAGIATALEPGDLAAGVEARARVNPGVVAQIRVRLRSLAAETTALPAEIEDVVQLIGDIVRSRGQSPTDVRKRLVRSGTPEDVARAAQAEYERRTGRIRNLREPKSVQRDDLMSWYAGPGPDDLFWPALRAHLAQKPVWRESRLQMLDDASTKVMSLLPPPALSAFSTRGLVIGFVQSGKTANYSALIAKAADAGYKFFIVLTGMHNNLRAQTQKRLQAELNALNPQHWIGLTDETTDFGSYKSNASSTLGKIGNQKVLCVVKKNKSVLEKLLRWIGSADKISLANCPVLVIDDEADQASISPAFAERRTVINNLIIRTLQTLPRSAYVGYTATPFANVLIDPTNAEDLYPRDFIVDLPKPEEYFGAERIFGREPLSLDAAGRDLDGLDMIRSVPDDESLLLVPPRSEHRTFEPELTDSLRASLRYFWMATAARRARGQISDHSSMLIHTTLYTEVQERLRPLVEDYRESVQRGVLEQDPELLRELRAQWAYECEAVDAENLGARRTEFAELAPQLPLVLSETNVIVENSRQDIRLFYPEDRPETVIAIGGNTLSRGLTLEGLVVSFFVRNATAYDTLLQMGRWFGYRGGYEDLPRIWMTDELRGYFYDLATVEQEIRYDARRYEAEALTPRDFGLRIRTHPTLAITSRLKMQAAVPCNVSLSGERIQTILFNHRNTSWLRKNFDAAVELIDAMFGCGLTPAVQTQYRRFNDVPVALVHDFFEKYEMHSEGITQSGTVREYIRAQNEVGDLRMWTVIVVSRSTPGPTANVALGHGIDVKLLNRSRLKKIAKPYANVKAIMSPIDSWADGSVHPPGATRRVLKRNERPMLLLYPIDAVSAPDLSSSTREALDAVDHVMGVGMLFPVAREDTTVEYMTVDGLGYTREEESPDDEVEVA